MSNSYKWHLRTVVTNIGNGEYGCIKFDGHAFEPKTDHKNIRAGDRVEVRQLTGVGRIAVRKWGGNRNPTDEEEWVWVAT